MKRLIFYFPCLITVLLSGCGTNKNLISVLVEDKTGKTELLYRKSQSPTNLVKEIKYYPNGDTLSVTPMSRGAVEGVVSRFFKNNKLQEQITFQNGTQNGPYTRFDNEGVPVFQGQLINGVKTGVWTTWYDEVQKQEERSYKDDIPDGKWTYWYIDGSIKREEIYKDGKLLEGKDF